MTLKELLTDKTWIDLQTINNKYPNFANYVIIRFGNYESRYEKEVFRNLWLSLIVNNQAELAFAETLVGETNEKLAPEKFGDVVATKSINKNARNTENLNSYKGYDIEGDFSKLKTAAEANNENTVTSNAVNYFGFISSINRSFFKDTWKNVVKQIMDLCITIYPIY